MAAFVKICLETQNLVKIGQMSGTLHEDISTFYCCQRQKFAIKEVYATFSILNNIHGMQCCASIGRVVTRTHHSVLRTLPTLFFCPPDILRKAVAVLWVRLVA
jgi:hypothetical protein